MMKEWSPAKSNRCVGADFLPSRLDRGTPEWFTPPVIARVPDEYIPPRFLGGLGGAQRERRGSAAGSVRESFRLSTREGAEEEER
jgi:hypothetical protein